MVILFTVYLFHLLFFCWTAVRPCMSCNGTRDTDYFFTPAYQPEADWSCELNAILCLICLQFVFSKVWVPPFLTSKNKMHTKNFWRQEMLQFHHSGSSKLLKPSKKIWVEHRGSMWTFANRFLSANLKSWEKDLSYLDVKVFHHTSTAALSV